MLEPPSANPPAPQTGNLLTNPGMTPGQQFLYQLDEKFSAETAKGGGAAFSSWFAPNAVTLAEGKAPVVGRDAIAAQATWKPQSYHLTWTPEGARMGPSGDMGVTWGHYESVAVEDSEGHTLTRSGRYMTVWEKQPDGQWKVALDASNDGPPEGCCSLPQ